MSLHYAADKLRTASEHEDRATTTHAKATATTRIERWSSVLTSALTGRTTLGARTPIKDPRSTGTRAPVRDIPPFITPEVMDGGFVTGKLCAAGPLLPFERLLVQHVLSKVHNTGTRRLTADDFETAYETALRNETHLREQEYSTGASTSRDTRSGLADAPPHQRENLNAAFLTAPGIQFLQNLLKTRRYHVQIPEEAALLTMSALLLTPSETSSHVPDLSRATGLVREIAPFFELVRFYPRPASSPIPTSLQCSILTPSQVRNQLEVIQNSGLPNRGRRFMTYKIVIEQLTPCYDALLSLILATCQKVPLQLLGSKKESEKYAANSSRNPKERMRNILIPFRKRASQKMHEAFTALDLQFTKASEQLAELNLNRLTGKKKFRILDPKRCNRAQLLEAARIFFSKGWVQVPLVKQSSKILAGIFFHGRKTQLPQVWEDDFSLKDFGISTSVAGNTERQPLSEETKMEGRIVHSEPLRLLRSRQRLDSKKNATVLTKSWVLALKARLEHHCPNDHVGVRNLSPLLSPCTASEEQKFKLTYGCALPIRGVRMMNALELMEYSGLMAKLGDVIPSIGVFARCLQPFVAGVLAGKSIDNDGTEAVDSTTTNCIRCLNMSASGAFKKRRSLLLLNCASQVRIDELPWTPQINRMVKAVSDDRGVSSSISIQHVLFTVVKECLTRWPSCLVTNGMVDLLNDFGRVGKLSSVLSDLSGDKRRKVWCGLLPEIAADIFQGSFMEKWAWHAVFAKQLLKGTLYDVYYRRTVVEGYEVEGKANVKYISWKGLSIWDTCGDENIPMRDRMTELNRLCHRSGWSDDDGSYVAKNGCCIETGMLITGHNFPAFMQTLQVLGRALSAEETLQAAVKAFVSICALMTPIVAAQRVKKHHRHGAGSRERRQRDSEEERRLLWNSWLRIAKKVADGWRQMIMLVSILPEARLVDEFFAEVLDVTDYKECDEGREVMRKYVKELRSAWYVTKREGQDSRDGICEKLSWDPLRGWVKDMKHPLL